MLCSELGRELAGERSSANAGRAGASHFDADPADQVGVLSDATFVVMCDV